MNELLKLFGVNSNKELLEYIKNNPKDKKTQEIIELLQLMNISIKLKIISKRKIKTLEI